MLIEGFYHINSIVREDNSIAATIILNENHEVYKGHFHEQPVVPGVIQLQIAKEIIRKVTKRELKISNLIQVKYLSPIIPDKNSELTVNVTLSTVNDNEIKTNFTIKSSTTIFTKAKVIFL